MFALPDKIFDAIAGEPWGLRRDFRQDELSDPTSDLVQETIWPLIFDNANKTYEDDEFYRFFHFERTLQNKLWEPCLGFKKFTGEAPFRYNSKVKEIEKSIRAIDPALLGEKRSTKKWFWQRLIEVICAIFNRICTSNNRINALFCCRNSLEFRFEDLKSTIPLPLKTEITDAKLILPQIQEIIKAGFPKTAEADMLNYILETALPQEEEALKRFSYDKGTGKFTIKYSCLHHYQAKLNLGKVGMGEATLTVVCSALVEGTIDTFEKTISFTSGISVREVVFLEKETLFFSRPIANKIEKNSQSEHPPSLEFIQMLEGDKIRVKGCTTLTIPDFLTAPILSYQAVRNNLSRISWNRQEVIA